MPMAWLLRCVTGETRFIFKVKDRAWLRLGLTAVSNRSYAMQLASYVCCTIDSSNVVAPARPIFRISSFQASYCCLFPP